MDEGVSNVPVIRNLFAGAGLPRTGGVRIVHLADATMHPVFVMVEENRELRRFLNGVDGKVNPFATFRDTVSIVGFLPPIPPSVFAASETCESYATPARMMKEMADQEKRRYERLTW
jgi:hypothetical protein